MIKFCIRCLCVTERDEARGRCKPCRKATAAAWYVANSESKKAYATAWRAANPERHNAAKALWAKAARDANRENKMPKIAIKNLTHKATEQLTVKILAQKAFTPDKDLRFLTLQLKPPKPRKYPRNMARSPSTSVFARPPYVAGDGDEWHQIVRPGAEDALLCKSVGVPT